MQYIKFLLETLPNANTSELNVLLPWSPSLPEHCRVPQKTSNAKTVKPKYSNANGPLQTALRKMREKFALGNL